MIRVLVSRSTLLRRPFATASRRFDSSLLLIKSLAKQATGTSYFYSTASSSGQSPPTNNRQRRSLQLVAGASLVAGSFCYYCLIENNTRNVNLTSSSSSRRWIHADPRSVQRLTQEQVDAILTQNQSKVLLHTNTAVVSVCHTNNVRSNDPIEDYSSNHSIPKPAAVAASGGGFWGRGNKSTTTSTPSTTAPQLLLGVYDGHGGREV